MNITKTYQVLSIDEHGKERVEADNLDNLLSAEKSAEFVANEYGFMSRQDLTVGERIALVTIRPVWKLT